MANKGVRKLMYYLYGKACMFKSADIARRIEEMGGIRTYNKFLAGRKFTLKKRTRLETELTFHHLTHSDEGGETSIKNGAILSRLAHDYIHSLPREHEEIINDMLRAYKEYLECEVIFVEKLETGIKVTGTPVVFSTQKKKTRTKATGNKEGEYKRTEYKRITKQSIRDWNNGRI